MEILVKPEGIAHAHRNGHRAYPRHENGRVLGNGLIEIVIT